MSASSVQCEWTANPQVPWIAVVSGRQGRGNGAVVLRIEPVTGPARTGAVTIGGRTVQIEQGTGCSYSAAPTTLSLGSAGGTADVQVSAPAGCAWTAASHANWITIASGHTGTGAGVVSIRVGATDGPSRTGTMTVAGVTVAVTQSPGCGYVVEPRTHNLPASGGSGVIGVRTAPGCPWSATSSAEWVGLSEGAPASGPGELRFSVAPSSGPARTATVRVAEQTVTINQASGCTFSISPSSQQVGGAGGAGSVQVNAGAGCEWTATSNASWIAVTSGAGGSGSGRVDFTVSQNAAPSRTGTLTVAGQTFTVAQASLCTYALVPPFMPMPVDGGNGAVLVIVSGPCTWTASSTADWVRIYSGTSGAGDGVVQFTVDSNSGPARTGIIVIARQNYEVRQAGR